MKILLVRPRQPENTIGLQHLMVVEPLELEVVGALVQPPDEVVIVDLILEPEPFEHFLERERPDVVGFTGYITNVGVVQELARRTKRFDSSIRTIIGGPHAEVCPQDFDIPEIDFRVVRNATTQFLPLLDHLAGKGPLPGATLAAGQACDWGRVPDFDFTYPLPRRDLTNKYRSRYFYLYQDRVALLKTSFGCPYSCTFCFCRLLTGGRYHVRSLDAVFEELEGVSEREIYIVDDDFLVSRDRVLAFIDGVRQRGLKKRFQVYGRADFIADNPDVIEAFRAIGLSVVIIGLESFDDSDLVSYNKRLLAEVNIRAMEVLNANAIDVYATIILSPSWTAADFACLDGFMRRLKIRFANLQPLTPLPGIEYRVDQAELIERRDDWAKWDLAHVTVRPAKLTVREFYAETMRLYRRMIWRPSNLIRNFKYPLHMQVRIIRGLRRVDRQYARELRDAASHA
jgi:radical SAM superfamily enzyme YgiQ (UPF0313 family)